MTVLVYPFENAGDAQYSWVAAGMTSTVVSDLSMVKGITVISDAERKRALQELAFAQAGLIDENKVIQAGKITGADIILSGSYTVSSEKIRVTVNMTETETGRIRKSARIDGLISDLFSVQDQIVRNLFKEAERIETAGDFPVRISSDDTVRIQKIRRPAFTAYEFYSRGYEIISDNPSAALEFFKKALSLQPDYPEAGTGAGLAASEIPGKHDEALKYLNYSDNIYKKRKLNKTAVYADLKNIYGNLYYKKGDFSAALRYYSESLAILKEAGHEKSFIYADTLTNIGNSFYSSGNPAAAFRNYSEAAVIRKESGGERTSAYAVLLMNLGIASAAQGRYEEATDYFKKSEVIYTDLGLKKTPGFANLLMNTGNLYLIRGDADNALKFYELSKELMEKLGHKKTPDYASLLFNSGVAYERKGDAERAGENYRSAFEAYDDSGYSGPQRNEALRNAVRLSR